MGAAGFEVCKLVFGEIGNPAACCVGQLHLAGAAFGNRFDYVHMLKQGVFSTHGLGVVALERQD